MNLKVLPLNFWQKIYLKDEWKHVRPELREIPPKLNRDGYYLKGDLCWFEISGKAFLYDKESFMYDIEQLNHIPLLYKEKEAIETLIKSNKCPKSLRTLLVADEIWKRNHHNLLTIRMRLRNFKKKHKIK